MLGENIRSIRKAKGMSQEDLALRLNVVRQTVSKWEKGLSVPDADLLQKIAEVFEMDVSSLLGAPVKEEQNAGEIALLLSDINAQLAERNRRARRVWKTVAGVLIAAVVVHLLLIVLSLAAAHIYSFEPAHTDVYSEEIVIDE